MKKPKNREARLELLEEKAPKEEKVKVIYTSVWGHEAFEGEVFDAEWIDDEGHKHTKERIKTNWPKPKKVKLLDANSNGDDQEPE